MIEYSRPESTPPPRTVGARGRPPTISHRPQDASFGPLLVTSLVALLVLVVNLGFTFLRTSQTSLLAAVAPQLTPVIDRQDAVFSLIMLVMSVVLVIAVALKTIVETHHTAGAVYAVANDSNG